MQYVKSILSACEKCGGNMSPAAKVATTVPTPTLAERRERSTPLTWLLDPPRPMLSWTRWNLWLETLPVS